MQNATKNQIQTLMTRVGENSKLIILGDLNQTDNYNDNGLNDFVERFTIYSDIHQPRYISHVQLTMEDIKRHPSVVEVLDVYSH